MDEEEAHCQADKKVILGPVLAMREAKIKRNGTKDILTGDHNECYI